MTKVGFTRLSTPPQEYTFRWASDAQRAIDQLISILLNPGPIRADTLTLTNLFQHDVGAEAGTVYLAGNTLKISQLDISACAGTAASTSVGTVQVNIT